MDNTNIDIIIDININVNSEKIDIINNVSDIKSDNLEKGYYHLKNMSDINISDKLEEGYYYMGIND
jgi:hypothetical protein